jgi:hypothetical protein
MDAKLSQSRFAPRPRDLGDASQVSREHCGAPNTHGTRLRGACNGLEENPLQCTLAELARDETLQEFLLGWRCVTKQESKLLATAPR